VLPKTTSTTLSSTTAQSSQQASFKTAAGTLVFTLEPVAALHQGAPGHLTWLEDPPPWLKPWLRPA